MILGLPNNKDFIEVVRSRKFRKSMSMVGLEVNRQLICCHVVNASMFVSEKIGNKVSGVPVHKTPTSFRNLGNDLF